MILKTVFGFYNVIAVIILLNMLIGMMAKSYDGVEQKAQQSWAFHRTKNWMMYVKGEVMTPCPMNLQEESKICLCLCNHQQTHFHKISIFFLFPNIPLLKKYSKIVCVFFRQHVFAGKICGKFDTTESSPLQSSSQQERDNRYIQTVHKLVKRYQVKYLKDCEVSKEKPPPPLILTFQDERDGSGYLGSRNLNVSVENLY